METFRPGDEVIFPHRGEPVLGVVQYLVGNAAVVDTDEGTRYPMIDDMLMYHGKDSLHGEDVRMRARGVPGLFDAEVQP